MIMIGKRLRKWKKKTQNWNEKKIAKKGEIRKKKRIHNKICNTKYNIYLR